MLCHLRRLLETISFIGGATRLFQGRLRVPQPLQFQKLWTKTSIQRLEWRLLTTFRGCIFSPIVTPISKSIQNLDQDQCRLNIQQMTTEQQGIEAAVKRWTT